MKYKYDRLSKTEKKELFVNYTKNYPMISKKFNRLKIICIIGVIYSIVVLICDVFLKNSSFNIYLDVIVFIFCIFALIKINFTKRELLNNFLLKNERDNKVKLYKNLKK